VGPGRAPPAVVLSGKVVVVWRFPSNHPLHAVGAVLLQ